jgi:hypothetical protein
MAKNLVHADMPLTDQDMEALDEIFEKVKVEDIKQIEQRAAHYSAVPLEPWEERGWVLNSSLPQVKDPLLDERAGLN